MRIMPTINLYRETTTTHRVNLRQIRPLLCRQIKMHLAMGLHHRREASPMFSQWKTLHLWSCTMPLLGTKTPIWRLKFQQSWIRMIQTFYSLKVTKSFSIQKPLIKCHPICIRLIPKLVLPLQVVAKLAIQIRCKLWTTTHILLSTTLFKTAPIMNPKSITMWHLSTNSVQMSSLRTKRDLSQQVLEVDKARVKLVLRCKRCHRNSLKSISLKSLLELALYSLNIRITREDLYLHIQRETLSKPIRCRTCLTLSKRWTICKNMTKILR